MELRLRREKLSEVKERQDLRMSLTSIFPASFQSNQTMVCTHVLM